MSETRTVRLGSLIKPAGKRAGENSELPVYSVTKHQGFVPSLEYFKKQVFSRETKSYKVVEKGQFAYATIHLDEGSIGIAPEKCIISPMYTVFEVASEEVIPEYLLLYLKGPRAMATYPLLGQGAIERRMTISLKSLSTFEIPLPPLEQQEREVKSYQLQTTIAKKRERQQELFEELSVSHYERYFGQRDKFDWVKLGDITSKIGSGATPKGGSQAYKPEGIALIRSMNVHDRRFVRDGLAFIDDEQAAALSNVEVQENDILLNITGASVARVCRVPADVLPARVNQHVAIIRLKPDTIEPELLERYLTLPSVKRRLLKVATSGGATREAITKTDLIDLRVPIINDTTIIRN